MKDDVQPLVTRVQNYRRGKVRGNILVALKMENSLQYLGKTECEFDANTVTSFSIDVPVTAVNKADKVELYFWEEEIERMIPLAKKSCTEF